MSSSTREPGTTAGSSSKDAQTRATGTDPAPTKRATKGSTSKGSTKGATKRSAGQATRRTTKRSNPPPGTAAEAESKTHSGKARNSASTRDTGVDGRTRLAEDAAAHKANLPAQVRDTVRDTAATARAKAADLKNQAHTQTARVTAAVTDKTHELTAKTEELGGQAYAKLPPQVRERVSQSVDRAAITVRQRPLPAAALTAIAVFVVLSLIRMLRAKR
jgi:hypothetical protein